MAGLAVAVQRAVQPGTAERGVVRGERARVPGWNGVVLVKRAKAFDESPTLERLAELFQRNATRLAASDPARAREPEWENEPRIACGPGGCGVSPMGATAQQQRADTMPAAPVSAAAAAVEQTDHGQRPPVLLLESFDGHGYGIRGPHGTRTGNNPSDNSLAVGPNHIVETVNTSLAVYTKKGELYDRSGTIIFGPIATNVLFAGFGGECERSPNGDAVVRYDQLARRWLYVMPLFRRALDANGEATGPYGMCYAVSVGENPLGPWYRYYFERELFPDYPRPAIWPDGWYIPTSTGDNVIEKHACVVDRTRMLNGEPATEQCIIIQDVNFLNNADIDGWGLPPAGAPNIMMATGGTQLRNIFTDDGIYVWEFHVDWAQPSNTRVTGPVKIPVAPYNYLCNGQLTRCVPQPETEMRIDAQGDKIMQRLVYRNRDGVESIVAVHSVNTSAGGGGVRWYEFRINENRDVVLHQQGTYAPEGFYRWMASPGIDRQGNIGIGYSFGGPPHYPGQRFAARLADDPPGVLTFRETVLVEGEASQTNTLRWEDYTQLSIDPVDDCTMWYVGDYLKRGAPGYTTRIGAFRIPGCLRGTINGTVFFDRNHNGMREPNEPGLPGWRVAYAGREGGTGHLPTPRDTIRTDSIGDYRVSLPADPAYAPPVYTISSPAATNRAWQRILTGNAYAAGEIVPMTNGTYTIRLRDRDDVSFVNFGNVCVIPNTGGAGASHWTGQSGRATLLANDQQPVEGGRRGGRGGGRRGGRGGSAGWRNLLNGIGLVNADGSRFSVPAGPFDDAFNAFRTFVSPSGSNAAHALSIQLAFATLNTTWNGLDGEQTVADPVSAEWITISAALSRAASAIDDRNQQQITQWRSLIERLNNNTAEVTPTSPARCPPPF